jgi:hypothetical protein
MLTGVSARMLCFRFGRVWTHGPAFAKTSSSPSITIDSPWKKCMMVRIDAVFTNSFYPAPKPIILLTKTARVATIGHGSGSEASQSGYQGVRLRFIAALKSRYWKVGWNMVVRRTETPPQVP